MLVRRVKLRQIINLIDSLAEQKFNINLQYKFIKIRAAVAQEEEIFNQQIQQNIKDFVEVDENGEVIVNENGGYKIKEDKAQECQQVIDSILCVPAQIPDMYLSLDELTDLDLTLSQLECISDFIR